jgi:hypothetical protein
MSTTTRKIKDLKYNSMLSSLGDNPRSGNLLLGMPENTVILSLYGYTASNAL